MRFYLNVPLVAGFVLMAISACLGMLQLAAARGGYAGLALFSEGRKRGTGVGVGLTVGALLAYVLFAPEILTPGPAGTEVAEMFALCALFALIITLFGADRRIARKRATHRHNSDKATVTSDNLRATFHLPTTNRPAPLPAVVLVPDPSGFVVTPATVITALRQAGIAVLTLDAQDLFKDDVSHSRKVLLGYISTALAQLAQQPDVDAARTGLLGLGLGGNAVLQAASADPQLKAALAVSPVGSVVADSPAVRPGLHWLRELSYRQVWRWRRQWPTLRRAAVNLRRDAVLDNAAILQASDSIFATRSSPPDIGQLTVPSHRHFTLLEEKSALTQMANWFQEKLSPSPSQTTQHATRKISSRACRGTHHASRVTDHVD